MKTIDCKIYDNLDYYTKDIAKSTNKLDLSDTDVKIWQSIIPNNFIQSLETKNSSVIPLFNLSSILNEAENFTSKEYEKLEASFKNNASFLTGMIMAVIYAQKNLNANEIYHYNFIKKHIVQSNKTPRKPDFLVHDMSKDKYYLVEAKCSANGRVVRGTIINGIQQVSAQFDPVTKYVIKNNNTIYYRNIKIANKYVVASGFPKKKLQLNIIDPAPNEEIDPVECIEDLYSAIRIRGMHYLYDEIKHKKFHFINLNFENTEATIGIYDEFYNLNQERYYNNQKRLEAYERTWKKFSKALPSYYNRFNKKYENVIFYDGLMIAYNNKKEPDQENEVLPK